MEQSRLTGYLLAVDHPRGRHKARFFARQGYWPINANALRAELLRIAAVGEVAETTATRYGISYVVDGELAGAESRPVQLRTVWFINRDSSVPRLLTAYPR